MSTSNSMRPTFKLIPDFILPNLENATYGHHLQWEDKRKGYFKISRIHQSSDKWSEDCIAVYKAWSLKKRLWKSDDPKRITRAKHRLVTALRRNPEIEMLKKEPSYYRFRVITHSNSDDLDSTAEESMKDENYEVREVKRSEEMQNIPQNIFLETEKKKPDVETLALPVFKDTYNRSDDHITFHNYAINDFESESYNEGLYFSLTSCETFPERHHLAENQSQPVSDKCCCDILLDSSFLSNQRCIWHGI
ncbi:hypothetical protein X975_10939, partial [Stegodyphus mimosarum]